MAKKRYLTLEDHVAPQVHVLHCAENASLGESQALTALKEVEAQSLGIAQEMRSASQAVQSLESIARYLDTSVKGDTLDAAGQRFLNLAVESICLQGAVAPGAPALSMEAYAQNPQLALEGAMNRIAEKVKDLYAFIKEKLVAFFKLLAEKMDYYKRNMGNLTRQLKTLEAQLARLDPESRPSIGALKPEWWLINLIYLEKGFPRYAEGISDELSDLLAAHAGLFTKAITKQLAWLKDNHAAVVDNGQVINGLTVKRDDFLIMNSKFIDSATVFDSPEENNVYYRSRELPGGKALYTHIQPYDQHGLLAIGMLASLRVQIGVFDLVSYDQRELQIAEFARLGAPEWYESLPQDLRASFEESQNTGLVGKAAAIDRSMVIEVLPLMEARKRLAEVKRNLANLESWYDAVYGKVWKDKDFDDLAKDLMREKNSPAEETEFVYDEARGYQIAAHAEQGRSYLSSLVVALLGVMGNATEYTHHYAFGVCESMLKYVEQSLRQYPKP